MPNIVQYENTQNGLQPSEIGVESTAQAGRHIGAFYNQWSEALRQFGDRTGTALGRSIADAGAVAAGYMEHREISQGAANFAQLNDALTQKWNDTAKNADPNDPTTATKFREEMEPTLEKFRDSFMTEGGQKWAETRVDALRSHMFEKTSADMSSLAAQAVSNNVRQMTNTMSNTAMTDPSAVDHLIDSVKHSVGGMVDSSPNIRGVDAAKAKMQVTESAIEHIVKSGAIGAIAQSGNPEATAAEWGRRYPQYISGDELKTLGANARQQVRAARMDDAYAHHIEQIDATERDDKAKDQVLRNLYSDDPQERQGVNAKAIVNNPNLKPATKENLIRLTEREMKPETERRISEQSTVGLLRQLYAPDADVDAVVKAATEARVKDPGSPGSITQQDYNTIRNEAAGRKTPEGQALAADRGEFFKRYAASIDPTMQEKLDTRSSAQFYRAEMDARRQEAVLKQKGLDPHLVYDPRSEYFFGKSENLAKYNVSLADKVKAKALDLQSGINLTGPGKTTTGSETIEIPAGMSPEEALEKYAGKTVRLPNGDVRTMKEKPR